MTDEYTIILWHGDGGTLSVDELELLLHFRCNKQFRGKPWKHRETEMNISRFCDSCIRDFREKGVIEKRHRVSVSWVPETKIYSIAEASCLGWLPLPPPPESDS
jgi:hypothetical protein